VGLYYIYYSEQSAAQHFMEEFTIQQLPF